MSNVSTLVTQNTDWSSTAANQNAVIAADAQTGDFPLSVGSASSAAVAAFIPGTYSEVVAGASGDTDVALAELFDIAASYSPSAPRLINLSSHAFVAGGEA